MVVVVVVVLTFSAALFCCISKTSTSYYYYYYRLIRRSSEVHQNTHHTHTIVHNYSLRKYETTDTFREYTDFKKRNAMIKT